MVADHRYDDPAGEQSGDDGERREVADVHELAGEAFSPTKASTSAIVLSR